MRLRGETEVSRSYAAGRTSRGGFGLTAADTIIQKRDRNLVTAIRYWKLIKSQLCIAIDYKIKYLFNASRMWNDERATQTHTHTHKMDTKTKCIYCPQTKYWLEKLPHLPAVWSWDCEKYAWIINVSYETHSRIGRPHKKMQTLQRSIYSHRARLLSKRNLIIVITIINNIGR